MWGGWLHIHRMHIFPPTNVYRQLVLYALVLEGMELFVGFNVATYTLNNSSGFCPFLNRFWDWQMNVGDEIFEIFDFRFWKLFTSPGIVCIWMHKWVLLGLVPDLEGDFILGCAGSTCTKSNTYVCFLTISLHSQVMSVGRKRDTVLGTTFLLMSEIATMKAMKADPEELDIVQLPLHTPDGHPQGYISLSIILIGMYHFFHPLLQWEGANLSFNIGEVQIFSPSKLKSFLCCLCKLELSSNSTWLLVGSCLVACNTLHVP